MNRQVLVKITGRKALEGGRKGGCSERRAIEMQAVVPDTSARRQSQSARGGAGGGHLWQAQELHVVILHLGPHPCIAEMPYFSPLAASSPTSVSFSVIGVSKKLPINPQRRPRARCSHPGC